MTSLTEKPWKSKWLFFAAAVIAVLSVLLMVTDGFLRINVFLSPFEVTVGSALEQIFRGDAEFFIAQRSARVTDLFIYDIHETLIMVCPALIVIHYIVYGYKLRVGSLILSLSVLSVPSCFGYVFLQIFSGRYILFEPEDVTLPYILGAVIVVVGSLVCAAAALALPLIPKAGRFVAAGGLAVGVCLLLVGCGCECVEPTARFIIEQEVIYFDYFTEYLLMLLPALITTVLLIVLMFIHKDFCLFQKPSVTE